MNAAELIAILSKLDPDTEIVIVDADTGWLMKPLLENTQYYEATPEQLARQKRFGLYGDYSQTRPDGE